MNNNRIIEEIKKGNRHALDEVYKYYREDFIEWIVTKYNLPVEDAKDLFQQVVIIFYENIIHGKLVKFTSSVRTYLFAVGKHKVYRFVRSTNHSLFAVRDTIDEDNTEQEKDVLLKLKTTESSLEILGDPCKSLLELYYYHNKGISDIVALFGYKNTDTAKNSKYKCLKRLKVIFEKEMEKQKKIIYG